MNSHVVSFLVFLAVALCLAPSRALAQDSTGSSSSSGSSNVAATAVGSVPRLIKLSGVVNPQIAEGTQAARTGAGERATAESPSGARSNVRLDLLSL